ncbi:MAG: methyltransferase domain-containing protein [Alphaproteobacteria bacterium]|jgi:ubiquinone/menaquinone biosynthesis C-methylase UbiE|nr:methyltransferase domain-containing protein [Alphaproteobacteria bacterium]
MPAAAQSKARFWDRTAEKYARQPIADTESHERKLDLTRERLRADMHVLEFGCGTGSTAIRHAPYVTDILATDISPKMLEIARRRAEEAGVENICFERIGFEALQRLDASFDAVLGLSILHLIDDPAAAVRKVHRLLRPGGVFVSNTACIAQMNPLIRLAIPVMRLIGKAPDLTVFRQERLVGMVEAAGFRITENWRPDDGATVFLIAEKS